MKTTRGWELVAKVVERERDLKSKKSFRVQVADTSE
jgi:hypothetical protein